MKIILNGKQLEIPEPFTIEDLLVNQGIKDYRIAVEVNGEIIRRSLFNVTHLHKNDTLEVVHAIGGG